MAVKAMARMSPSERFTLEDDDTFGVSLDIAANGQFHWNVNAGSYQASGIASVINAQLTAFIKAYAIAEMGATFGMADTARLLEGVDILST